MGVQSGDLLIDVDGRCHAKTGLKIFVLVIPKEGLAGTNLAQSSFGMIPRIVLCYLHGLYFVVGVIPRVVKMCQPSLCLVYKNKNLKTCYSMTQL